jgi:hypothetical protein
MTLSEPLASGDPRLAEVRQSLAASLRQQGLSDGEVELLLSIAAPALFESDALTMLVRLPPKAIEERAPLETYPPAAKLVRVALMLVRNIDPGLKNEVAGLVERLGAAAYVEREAAETRLLELGRLAVPALKAVLSSADPEVAFRAERILLSQGLPIDGT